MFVTAGVAAVPSVPDLRPQHPQEQARQRLRDLRQRGQVLIFSSGTITTSDVAEQIAKI
jgi:hypothetical protein